MLGRARIGYQTGRQDIRNIRYTDDTTLLAESKEDRQLTGKALKSISMKFSLKMNSEKTNLMRIRGDHKQLGRASQKRDKLVYWDLRSLKRVTSQM